MTQYLVIFLHFLQGWIICCSFILWRGFFFAICARVRLFGFLCSGGISRGVSDSIDWVVAMGSKMHGHYVDSTKSLFSFKA